MVPIPINILLKPTFSTRLPLTAGPGIEKDRNVGTQDHRVDAPIAVTDGESQTEGDVSDGVDAAVDPRMSDVD